MKKIWAFLIIAALVCASLCACSGTPSKILKHSRILRTTLLPVVEACGFYRTDMEMAPAIRKMDIII